MTPEHFHQIGALYHAAREKTGAERSEFLSHLDPDLRRQIESLLAQPDEPQFLDRPTLENTSLTAPADSTVTILTAGASLGPYRIQAKLGAGGMGEVFRAEDTRLGRAVAIKVLHEKFTDRFEREARAIAALNHPHICTLHDVGPNYLVMEFIEGETLAQRLKRGRLSMEETLRYGIQIAAALAAAHAKAIVHRDLKPGNIMLAQPGVKVLDFGLAKSAQDETLTVSRAVMGTPAYMAPEQREGKPANARSDIYSFGCVLHEMAAGARPGSGPRLPSRSLEKIVTRCLEPDPDRRWQSVAELERALRSLAESAPPWKPIAAAAVAVLLLAAGAYVYLHRAPKLTDRDTIVLSDFDNQTGDPVFDDTLRQGLSVELQQSPFLSLIPDQKVQQTLGLMGQPKDARLTPTIAQQVCVRTGSAAVLEGSVAALGQQYILGLRARNCNTGAVLDEEQIQVPRREDVLNGLSQIARRFRTRVGESLATVEKHSTPLASATTFSLDALKAYSTAMKVDTSSGSAAGIPFFQRAIELDPQFAVAYANLGLEYSGIGESVLSVENTTKAWRLRNQVSDPEKFFIDFNYYRQVTGNLEKAYQTLELWFQTYPRAEDPSALDLLSGLSTNGTGRFERAIEAALQKLAADPNFIFGYHNLASTYFFLGRFPEAEGILQRASDHKLKTPALLVLRYNLAALQGNRVEMDRLAALAKDTPGAEPELAHEEALALARSGRLQDARRSSIRAIDLALQQGLRETAASYQAARAVWEALYGNAAEAHRSAVAALALSRGREVQYAAALALGFSGETSRSESLAADLEKRFPEDTFVQFTYSPVLRALAALDRGNPRGAIEHLQIAKQYELAVNGLNWSCFCLGGLHSAYIRGESLLALHRYAEAAAEFEKILDHRGLVGLDPIGALAHLQLGRVYALSGDKPKAKSAYQDFLMLWKNADPTLPLLQQAKAESAKLK